MGALPLTILCLNLIRYLLRPFVRVAVAVLARPIAGKRDVLGLRRHHRIRDVARGRNRGDVERKREGQKKAEHRLRIGNHLRNWIARTRKDEQEGWKATACERAESVNQSRERPAWHANSRA